MAKYDSTAALEILGAYAEQKDPTASIGAKDAAAKDLLQELAAMGQGQVVDLAASAVPGYVRTTVAIGFSFATVKVTYNPHQSEFIVFSKGDGGPQVRPSVQFNRRRGIFEGTETDKSRVPGPGEPTQRQRDALVVIAEAIVDVMKKA